MSKLNPQNATAYVGPGVLRKGGNITPVPNGHIIKKDGTSLKNGGKMIVKAGGQTHKVFKKKVDKGIGNKGDIVVDHTAGPSAGKWDKINLTEKSRAKTVKQGVASVKKWHKENPDYGSRKKKVVRHQLGLAKKVRILQVV